MPSPKISIDEFVRLFETGGVKAVVAQTGVAERNVYTRRRNIENSIGRLLVPPGLKKSNHPERLLLSVKDGLVMVGSDCHYWPNIISTAHRAFVHLAKELQPKAIIMNGDVFDGASISRHPPIGWESVPDVEQEVNAAQERMAEIRDAAPNAKRIWPLGNHDARFEMRLATVAPEFARMNGFHLKDHFPYWHPCYSCWINDDVVVKHRWKGGVHATHNNTLGSGKTMVTGHLHSLKVTPYSDYNGTRYGVDTGTLADPEGPQFAYSEDNPHNQRQGFAVLKFWKGKLLPPALVTVLDEGRVHFRGEVIDV